MHKNHLVIGAGIAGLACARELVRGGHTVRVLDKARGVGGRCATRRIEGQPVDFGPVFLHGSDIEFLKELQSIPSVTILEDWPARRRGAGKPCQHEAFQVTEKRFAIAEGLSAFPKFLAQNLDIKLRTHVEGIELKNGSWHISGETGEGWESGSLVLTMPVEQVLRFIWPLVHESEELEAIATLLDMVPSLPCLTVIAGYGLDAPEPSWDVFYPEQGEALMLVSHDSAKRKTPKQRVLVLQATPGWSRRHLEAPEQDWSQAMLSEASRWMGDWVTNPQWTQTHRWRYSRVDLGNELAGPVRVQLPGNASLGLTGDIFAPGGGAEAAFCAGCTLARRLLQEDEG